MKTHQTKENAQAIKHALTQSKRSNDQRAVVNTQLQRQQNSDDSQQTRQLKHYFASQQTRQTEAIQRAEDEELTQAKFDTAQRIEEEEPAQRAALEEEPVQAKFDPVQRVEEEEPAQRKSAEPVNNTGLPNQLKAGIESMSGISMDHVKVHYNSDKPAQLNAHAYAQGSDIHVAPGQEQHVPHEAWHVVQQAQGRVKPTMQMKMGVPVNDDVGLETEADVMGAKAMQLSSDISSQNTINNTSTSKVNSRGISAQLKSGWKGDGDKYHRVANKDVSRAVPESDLGKPKNYTAVSASIAESQGGCWYPDVDVSVADTNDIPVVLMHDSDPGAKITPYSKNKYTNAPPKSEFIQEPHHHKGTLKAKRIKDIAAAVDKATDFSDKPVTYTSTAHDYVDANAHAATDFDRL